LIINGGATPLTIAQHKLGSATAIGCIVHDSGPMPEQFRGRDELMIPRAALSHQGLTAEVALVSWDHGF
jgi:hypothetical protein